MNRRAFLGAAGVAAVAGCLGDDERPENDEDRSENGTEEEGDEDDPDREETLAFPPGTSESGVGDPEALADAYRSVLEDTAYRYRESFELNGTIDEEATTFAESLELVVEPTRERYRYVKERDHEYGDATVEGYRDGDDEFVRRDGRVERARGAEASSRPTDIPPDILEILTFEYAGTGEAGGVHEFTASGYGDFFDDRSGTPTGTPDGVLRVDEQGLLTAFDGSFALDEDGEELEFDLEWTFDEVGTATVEKPDWMDETPAKTYDGFLDRVDGYDGPVDMTGRAEVTIEVGAGTDGLGFDPTAVIVDEGTTVVWEWNDADRDHKLYAIDGSFESYLTGDADYTYRHTFDERGAHRYFCSVHSGEMRGVVEVV